MALPTASAAVIFDLDGVLTDTAELHFQSWMDIARELDIPFDRTANEALRGLSRPDSLKLFLGARITRFSDTRQIEIMVRKNRCYLERVEHMSPANLLPGARELLATLNARQIPLAVASSSKNALVVLERLEIQNLLDAVVDGNDVPQSKPDPRVFLTAAERLSVPPQRCIVVEDAASGVAGALAGGMKVIGIGPPERVGQAHLVVQTLGELDADRLLAVLDN
ncbi:MAG: beta-phosphoglucomutase [Planctomycetota bacterium]